MILNKITVGFVSQTYDTETKKFTAQEFVASDETTWENTHGEKVEPQKAYLRFDMIQPLNSSGSNGPDRKHMPIEQKVESSSINHSI